MTLQKVACRGCGKTIVWAMLPEGGSVPLDPAAPVYCLVQMREGIQAVRTELSMAGHSCGHFAEVKA